MNDVRRRIAGRLRRDPRRALVRVFGRPLVCADCGRPIGRAIVFSRRGRVRLLGVREHNVRVAFEDKETLAFRHLELDRCPSPERPWVS